MKYNETNFDNPTEIVSAFADFFSNSFSETNVNSTPCKLNGIAPNNLLNLRKVTLDDVKNAIRQIKAKMTMGPDNIPAFLIRDCAILLAYPLCIIYNMILENSVFPDLWKLSKVTPIFKKGDKYYTELPLQFLQTVLLYIAILGRYIFSSVNYFIHC